MEYLPDLKRLLLLIAVFVPIELLFALRKEQRLFRRGWANDLLYYVANGPIISVGVTVFIIVAIIAGERLVPDLVRNAVRNQPQWVQAIEVILIADIGFYGAHLAFHKIPCLWKFHAVHHSIEELDWLAAYRVHPLDQIITKSASLLPVFVLGFSEAAIATFALLYFWHSILLHANVRLSFGPLRWLIASPEFHHWHHANQPEAHDKNFAGQISLFDVIFRTVYMPKQQMPSSYGTDDPVPGTYLEQLIYPFSGPKDPANSAEGIGQ
jgi:sterol desaturase/sphingolipid hydroxylase (fatty acid hydroxylase superfamily)